MSDEIRLGYQASLVSLGSPTYGPLWLSVKHHTEDTVSCTQAENLVLAAERRTGQRPKRRTELLKQRIEVFVKSREGAEKRLATQQARFEPDYGRRGKLWTHGAFEPTTGQTAILMSPSRDSASHIQLPEKIFVEFPADRWLIIEDNLSIHVSRKVKLALAAWSEVQVLFIPKYACRLNLIEPWWKQLRSLALKGRRFESLDKLTNALNQALDYWNAPSKNPYWNGDQGWMVISFNRQ